MDQFVVSARKYRPITFDGVVGQRHVGETLKNAIRSNHLAQAFLFNGPRGVGKTTCARILAKTINCFNRTENIEACETCDSCQSFNDGHSLNIYELDAASNNKVEHIRELIEQVRFAPQLGTKKVYIIDEVHMLSASAFNAFLKTLEEPPAHAIFILATTEKHKILPTILSRCQVFDFNRIEVKDIARHLKDIAGQEKIETEEEALNLIALKSDGSLRDALSMFDQMVSYTGDQLTYHDVVDNLSILSLDYFFNLTDWLVQADISKSLLLFNEVLLKGFDGHNFILSFAEHLRNLLVAQDHRTIELLTLGEQIIEKYRAQTLRVSSPFLIKSLNLLAQADVQYKSAQNKRLLVELSLINIAALSPVKNGPASSDTQAQIPVEESKKKTEEPSPVSPSLTPRPPSKAESKPTEAIASKPASKEMPVDSVASIPDPGPQNQGAHQISPAKEPLEELQAPMEEVAPKEESVEPEKKAAAEIPKTDVPDKEISHINRSSEIKEVITNKVPPTKERQKMVIGIDSDTISISDYTPEDVNEDDENGGTGLQRNEEVSNEQFLSVWASLVKQYQEKNKISLFSTLSKYDPVLNEGMEIELTYDNKAQLQAIRAEKSFLLDHLRDELNNDHIKFKLKISEGKYQKAYTPAEKLEKMIEKNPSISSLKEKLDLDLD